jgi:type II secretory pathway pseudopilin PulG
LLPVYPGKIKAFTLIEVLITSAIFIVIAGMLIFVLNAVHLSDRVNIAKLSVEQNARNIMGWIVKDVRQTSSYQIINNLPTNGHIKFKQCIGHDGSNLLWSSEFIEYIYNPINNTLTRRQIDGLSVKSWEFDNIMVPPFDITELINNKLTVTVTVRENAIGNINPQVTLTTEIRLRNG